MPPSRRASKPALELNATAASLLGFLHESPMTGWDLQQHVEGIIGEFWHVTRSQIYRELKVLAEHGLVETMKTGPRDRQPYRLTAAGRTAFERWIAEDHGPPVMRIPVVLSVFFGKHVPFERLRAFVDAQRAHHQERLETYEGYRQHVPEGTWSHEALRMGLLFQRAMLEWLDTLPDEPLPPEPRKPPEARGYLKPAERAPRKRREG